MFMDLYPNPEYVEEHELTDGLRYAKYSAVFGVIGIVGIFIRIGFLVGFVCSILAIVFSRKAKARQVRTRMQLAGMIMGVIGLIAYIAALVLVCIAFVLAGVLFTGFASIL